MSSLLVRRYESLAKEHKAKRMADALKGARRARNLDEWKTEHVVAWFMEMEYDQYCEVGKIRSARRDPRRSIDRSI